MRLLNHCLDGPHLALALCVALVLTATTGRATKPRLWQENSYAAFAEGETDGVSIGADGTVRLAPDLEDFAELEVQRIWSLINAPDGGLYVGTGDAGKIFTVDHDGEPTLLFDSPELNIHALALGKDGALYAGTAPDGLIYRIEPGSEPKTLAHTDAHYVWDLAFSAEGDLYAATGEPGKVLSVSAGGKSKALFDAPDRHVMDLLVVEDRVYAATARAARVYELAGPGPARLLYESAREEIHALVAGPDGVLYASGLARDKDKKDDEKPGSDFYRIDPSGATQVLWSGDEVFSLSMVALADDILMAAANPSRLYRLDGRGRAALVAQFDEFLPSRLLSHSSGEVYLGSGQDGAIRHLGAGFRAAGQLESGVEDFGIQAQWGAIDWRADLPEDTGIHFQTRSGNSAETDETWSSWSEPLRRAGATIASPPARYLQYRAVLETSDAQQTPALRKVTVTGRQINVGPRIDDFHTLPYRVGQGGNAGNEKGPNAPVVKGRSGRSGPTRPKSLRLVRWKASDANGDELHYALYVRSIDQKEWKLGQENLEQTSVLWDTETMPEGLTLLKLVASDHPDNADGETLVDERVSAPFPIDNSPPRIELQAREADPLALEVKIADRLTPIRKAQYSVDYGDRQHQIAPADGVFDALEESARIVLPDLPVGEHVIAVQAWDQLDNVGTQQLIVQVK